MHQTIFTTSHVGLEEVYRVHWLRYLLSDIQNHASHRKIYKRNSLFRFTIEDFNSIRSDHAELHQRYYASIEFEGAMNIEECLFGEDYTFKNIYNTKCVSVFEGDRLIAGGYFDLGNRAAASILHFFDPIYKRNSLGKLLILLTINYLKSNGYKLYYPGY